jgi:hypothetical protein
VLDNPRARLVHGHRAPDCIDVRAGHDNDVGRAAAQQYPDDPGDEGFSRLTQHQRGLGLTHPSRSAGGQDDGANHAFFRLKSRDSGINA